MSRIVPCMNRAGPSMARAKSWRLVEPSVRPIVRPWCLAATMIDAAAASRPTTARRHLDDVATLTRGERLDEDADQGRAEDDEQRQDREVVDVRLLERCGKRGQRQRSDGGHFELPSATVPAGLRCRNGLLDVRQGLVDGRVDDVQRDVRQEAEHDERGDQRCGDELLARRQVTHGGEAATAALVEPVVLALAHEALGLRAGHDPLVHEQDVERGEDDAGRRDDRGHRLRREAADEHEELRDEARQAREGRGPTGPRRGRCRREPA